MSALLKKKVLKTKTTRDNKEVEVAVERPNHRHIQEAQNVHNRAFREALDHKAILKEVLEKHLREQGLWDDSRQAEYERLTKVMLEGEKSLKRGKIKLSEAKQIAFQMQDARFEMVELLSQRRALEGNTVQAQAENARFNYLVAACTVYNDTGKPVFKNLDDYLSHSTEEFAWEAATTLAEMLNGFDPDAEKKLPENAFLLKYKLVDEKLRPVDKDGNLVDRDGRRVDENGRYVNDQGELVDRDGNRVDAEGNYVFEDAGAFLDDDGNEVPDPDVKPEPETVAA
jgi:hypothetical protein